MIDSDMTIGKKAMAYDLLCIFSATPDKTYTAEEIEAIIKDYIKRETSKK